MYSTMYVINTFILSTNCCNYIYISILIIWASLPPYLLNIYSKLVNSWPQSKESNHGDYKVAEDFVSTIRDAILADKPDNTACFPNIHIRYEYAQELPNRGGYIAHKGQYKVAWVISNRSGNMLTMVSIHMCVLIAMILPWHCNCIVSICVLTFIICSGQNMHWRVEVRQCTTNRLRRR